MLRAALLLPLTALVLAGCGDGDVPVVVTEPHLGPAWLEGARILADGASTDAQDCRTELCRHNENTDVVAWGGAFWLVHRTAKSQILGPNSSLLVYRSSDGSAWTNVARIAAPVDRDIRDPHFYVVGDELRIKALTRLPVMSTRDSNVATIAVVSRSTDGVAWTDLALIGPPAWSFWRIREAGGVWYTAAYEDGDKSVVLFSSTDGLVWNAGATIYDVAEDTPLETELTFMPSGWLLALVRMDGTNDELLGDAGRLRTKVCWSKPPYDAFVCTAEIEGQRLDGPLTIPWNDRLFVVARKHLQGTGKKRTAVFAIDGDANGAGPLSVREIGELPSAGDTAYAGAAMLDDSRAAISWYSGDLAKDEGWAFGMFDVTSVWTAVLHLDELP